MMAHLLWYFDHPALHKKLPPPQQTVVKVKPSLTKLAGSEHGVDIFQGVLEDYDDLVFACGSGGTAAGLSIANYLTGSKIR